MIDTIYESNETYYVPVCDRCGDTLEPEEEFSDAVQAKKADVAMYNVKFTKSRHQAVYELTQVVKRSDSYHEY